MGEAALSASSISFASCRAAAACDRCVACFVSCSALICCWSRTRRFNRSARVAMSASERRGQEAVHEQAEHDADTEIEKDEAAGDQERHGYEIDRNLRRELVDEADRQIDQDRVGDEGAGEAQRAVERLRQGVDERYQCRLRGERPWNRAVL